MWTGAAALAAVPMRWPAVSGGSRRCRSADVARGPDLAAASTRPPTRRAGTRRGRVPGRPPTSALRPVSAAFLSELIRSGVSVGLQADGR